MRAAHYAGLWRALRSGGSVVVHDCGTQAWVRRWLAREARRRGRALHLVLLDVAPGVARQGQRERGRGVSGYAFARHRRAVGRLLRDTESGLLPRAAPRRCCSTVRPRRRSAGSRSRRRGSRGSSLGRPAAGPGRHRSHTHSSRGPGRLSGIWTPRWPGRRSRLRRCPRGATRSKVSAAPHGEKGTQTPWTFRLRPRPRRIRRRDGRPTSSKKCSAPRSAYPARADGWSRCSAAARSGCPCRTAAGPTAPDLDLPTVDIDGGAYVPVFSSEAQFLQCVGAHLSFTVAPAREFARGLPPQLGIAVNPGGAVGVPAAAGRRRRALPGRAHPAGRPRERRPGAAVRAGLEGGPRRLPLRGVRRVPGDRGGEHRAPGAGQHRGRRAPSSSSASSPPCWDAAAQSAPLDALGRALGRVQVPWPVNLVLLDVAQDPVGDWMLEKVRPFYRREAY